MNLAYVLFFFFSSRRRHTRLVSDWSSDVCSSDLTPAPCSTSTLWPSPTSDSTPAGTSATRCSAVLISLGTPTIMRAPRRSCVTSSCYVVALRLSGFAQPYDRLPLRRNVLRRHARHLFFGKPPDRRQYPVQGLIRLAPP